MPGNQETFQKAMNQGHSAAWDQDWQKAVDFYGQALEEFPDHPLALTSLGLAFFELLDYPNALECYRHAVKVSPGDAVPQEKMARIHERMGELQQAAEAYLKAADLHLRAKDVEKAVDNWTHVLSLFPEHLAVRQRLAAVYEKLGRLPESVNEYVSAASILQRSGDLTKALRTVEYALQIMPESNEARFALHTLRSNQPLPRPGRPRGGTGPMRMASARQLEAVEGERQADPLEEARRRALVEMAGMLFEAPEENSPDAQARRGVTALARGTVSLAGNSAGERARILMHIGQAIDSQSKNDELQAAKELERATELGLRHPAALYDLGYLLRARDPEKALHVLLDAARHRDYALAAGLLAGRLLGEAGRDAEAALAYVQALSAADAELVPPEQAEELLQAYEPILEAVRNEKDAAALRSIGGTLSVQLNRGDWRDYLKLARSQLPAQAPDLPPLPVAEVILESRSSRVVETMARVRTLAAESRLATATEEAFFALQSAPTYLPLHTQIGELLLLDLQPEAAVRKFTVVAELYAVRGETSRAARMYRRILQIAPMDLVTREKLVQLLISRDLVDEALKEYMDLADVYYRLSELEKARQTYLNALKTAQASKNNRAWGVQLLLKVADIDLQRLNLRQAVRIFEQIRTIQPENMEIRQQIVQLYFRMGQDQTALGEVDATLSLLESAGKRPQAVNFVNDLLVEMGANLDLRRKLADLYVRAGRTPEAVAQLDLIADAYAGHGKTVEAINVLETIVALRPPNVDDYRRALETLRRENLRR